MRLKILNLQESVQFNVKDNSDKRINKIEINDLQVSYPNGERISYPHIVVNKGRRYS